MKGQLASRRLEMGGVQLFDNGSIDPQVLYKRREELIGSGWTSGDRGFQRIRVTGHLDRKSVV